MGDVDDEKVNWGLRRADHVLWGCNELYYTVVQLGSLVPVHTLVGRQIKVKIIGDIVDRVTHVALPASALVHECDERVQIGPAASAPNH